MKYGYIFTLTLTVLLTVPFVAQAQCPAPAPTNLEFGYLGNTEVEINWDGVPGAQSYQVQVFNTSTGALINTDTLTDNTHTQEDLEPGEEYLFEVRSSYCLEGPYGMEASGKGTTTIIVVDIIFQMQCDGNISDTINQTITAGGNTDISFDPAGPDGCYYMTFNPQNDPNNTFSMVFSTEDGENLIVGNEDINVPDLGLFDQGPLLGYINSTKSWYSGDPIFDMKSQLKAGVLNIGMNWDMDVDVSYFFCSDCTMIETSSLQAAPTDEPSEAQAQVFPNPAKDVFNVSLPKPGGTLMINDFTGRRWFFQELPEGQQDLQVITQNWPAGTYVLQWISPGEAPQKQYLIKL